MMYVEFMKNFLLWWLLDRFEIPTLSWCTVRKIFFSFEGWTHFGILSPETTDSYFVDMMYLEFMKNFLLPDSTDLMAVRLILLSWAQKQVIPTL